MSRVTCETFKEIYTECMKKDSILNCIKYYQIYQNCLLSCNTDINNCRNYLKNSTIYLNQKNNCSNYLKKSTK